MVKFLIKFLIATVLTFNYGLSLSDTYEIIPFSFIAQALSPDRDWITPIHFLLWILTFYASIDLALAVLRFVSSGGIGRFSTTKLVRRVQGVVAELFMVGLLVLIGVLALTATPVAALSDEVQQANVARVEANKKAREEKVIQLRKQLSEIDNMLSKTREYWHSDNVQEAIRWIGYSWGRSSKEKTWKTRNDDKRFLRIKNTLSGFLEEMKSCANLKGTEIAPYFCKKLSIIEKQSQEYSSSQLSQLLKRTDNPSYFLTLVYKTYAPIVQKRDRIAAQLERAERIKLHSSPTPDATLGTERGTYWDRFMPTVDKYGGRVLLAALVLWLITRFGFKQSFSNFYSKILRFFDEGRMGFGGSARFAGMFEEWGKAYQPGALYMGRSLFNPFQEIGLKDEAHMLTVAASRAGKGATAIIPNLLTWQGSAVVIDPKGTNARVTAQTRLNMGQDVYLIDPFRIITSDSARFDPFENLNPDHALVRERITSIADALVIPDDHTKDPHWDDGARTIISGLIAHIISTGVYAKPWLYLVRDLINQPPEDQDRLWAEMSVNTQAGGFAKDAATRYIRGAETNEILSIMSSADKHTEWLSSKVMRAVTSEPTFKLSELKEKPTTVYLIIPPRQLRRQRRLLRLFINLMIDTMEQGGRSKVPVLMIMDEFLALGKMPEIEDAFATMASYNLIMWPFVQELGKLRAMYGGSFNAFLANARAVQIFGVSDPETTKYISERMGNRPLGSLGNVARSNENLPLRSPDDIARDINKDSRRQYILEAGKAPMLIEKVPYYDSHPLKAIKLGGRFEGKYETDPDFNNA